MKDTPPEVEIEKGNSPHPSDEKSSSHPKETDPLIPHKDGSGPVGPIHFTIDLANQVGYKLLVLLFSTQHLLKGFVNSFAAAAVPYLYKSYHVAGPQVQIYSSVTSLPWALKPVIGLVSDVFPIFGYNKAPYVLLSTIGGVIGMSCVGLLPHYSMVPSTVAVCLFLTSLQQSSCDLLSEAKYAEKMREKPGVGPALMCFVWFGLNIGGLVSSLSSGIIIERLGPKAPFVFSIIPCGLVLVPTAWGYFQEKKQTAADTAIARQKIWEQGEAVILCLLMLLGTLALSFTGLVFHSIKINAIVAITVGLVLLLFASVMLSPVIAKMNAFAMIQTSLELSIGGASFYFYTDTPKQFPEGPHFSPFFFNTVMSTMTAIFSLFGIWAYNKYMMGWRYRQLLIMANIMYSSVSLLDVAFFLRLNKNIGVPDHVFVLGASVVEQTIFQWEWMPQVVMMSHLCPKGMEATMYALLAGCHNLGNNIAANVGALMLEQLSVAPTGANNESKQFENIWKASLIASLLPLITILLLFKLIPDARQDESLVGDTDYDATSGSLWRQWTKNAS